MDCFPDFCLACDKQTMDGFYCSQACRLADLEKAGNSAPVSPSPSSAEQGAWQPFQSTRSSGLTLPAALDFTSTNATASVSTMENGRGPREKGLSPSTSRSSLSSDSSAMSTTSTQTGLAMSEQTQHELQGYVSSFDAIREMKRRSLTSNSGH